MDSNFSKLEIAPYELDCFNFEEDPSGEVLEWPAFDVDSSYADLNSALALPSKTNYIDQFKDFEEMMAESAMLDNNTTTATVPSLHGDIMVDAKPLQTVVGSLGQYCDNTFQNGGNSSEILAITQGEYGVLSSVHGEQQVTRRIGGRKRKSPLELDEIQKYFDFPISKAAKEMNVGLTVLKKRCRELNIMRWPHRKIKSLKALIDNVKELGMTNEIAMLEQHKRMLELLPDMELTERTKRLRQACFKDNYKKRRSLAA